MPRFLSRAKKGMINATHGIRIKWTMSTVASKVAPGVTANVGQGEATTLSNMVAGGDPTIATSYSAALSLGSRQDNSQEETERRQMIRAVLLAGLLTGTLKPGTTEFDAAKRDLLDNTTMQELVRLLKRLLPYHAVEGDFSNRPTWNNFTDPKAHDPKEFRYLVHGIMQDTSKVAEKGFQASGPVSDEAWNNLLAKYAGYYTIKRVETSARNADGTITRGYKEQLWVDFRRYYLEHPDVLQSTMISTSVIDQDHVSSYYPFGFILKVPPENVYSAAPEDQSVKNRAEDFLKELTRVLHNKAHDKLLTPEQVLEGTKRDKGNTGYNEVVVVGRSPEGKKVEVTGIFVKIAPDGGLYVRPGDKEPYVTPETLRMLVDAALALGIPLIRIVDSGSQPLTGP
jgi:hypothetical protein